MLWDSNEDATKKLFVIDDARLKPLFISLDRYPCAQSVLIIGWWSSNPKT